MCQKLGPCKNTLDMVVSIWKPMHLEVSQFSDTLNDIFVVPTKHRDRLTYSDYTCIYPRYTVFFFVFIYIHMFFMLSKIQFECNPRW